MYSGNNCLEFTVAMPILRTAAGFDTSGHYLLAECRLADDVILTLAELVSAADRCEPGWAG